MIEIASKGHFLTHIPHPEMKDATSDEMLKHRDKDENHSSTALLLRPRSEALFRGL
jgi:hypothetical protein